MSSAMVQEPATSRVIRRADKRGLVRPLSIAPMMQRTDRHFRWLMRRITRHTLLYTEMVVAEAILRGDPARFLDFDPDEHPVALQLGGDDPEALAACARLAEAWGYDEVNLNVGCPSDRVQEGRFGVCLMADPQRVADAVEAMRETVSLPVTVKHRIGFDERDRYADMRHFVEVVAERGCDRFTVHARKAWLQGLSPKDNRNVPPLRYDEIHRLRRDLPGEVVEINGGIGDLDAAEAHLSGVDAVMLGRAAYDHPWLFADADRRFFGDPSPLPSRAEVVEATIPYLRRWQEAGGSPHHVARHLLNLYKGCRGAKRWKRHLNDRLLQRSGSPEVLREAVEAVAA